MKLKVKIEDELYEVEIENLRSRPIIAMVDGELFEVWPVEEPNGSPEPANLSRQAPRRTAPTPTAAAGLATPAAAPETRTAPKSKTEATLEISASLNMVRAPIPRMITSISVQVGDTVDVGTQLCLLEAMKMNNAIRAGLPGVIAAIHVAVGQHVKHHEVLMEYSQAEPAPPDEE